MRTDRGRRGSRGMRIPRRRYYKKPHKLFKPLNICVQSYRAREREGERGVFHKHSNKQTHHHKHTTREWANQNLDMSETRWTPSCQ
jgi:hypothetical protein